MYFKSNNKIVNHKDDFKFIDVKNMPKKCYTSKTIRAAEKISWIRTGDSKDFAINQCGATAASNIVLYYKEALGEDFAYTLNNTEIFAEVYDILGNGSIMSISGALKKYFKKFGIIIKTKDLYSFEDLKKEIEKDNIVAILLEKGLMNWHWIICLGYRIYDDGAEYLRIMDGWNNNIDKFYKIQWGREWLSAASYFLK